MINEVTFTINASLLRSAALIAATNDGRHYLKYIFIGKDGKVLSSNGHCAFISSHTLEIESDYLIKLEGPIPVCAYKVHIKIIGSDIIAKFEKANGRMVDKRMLGRLFDLNEGKTLFETYPVQAIDDLVNKTEDFMGADFCFLDGVYLSLCAKVFGKKHHAPIKITRQTNSMYIVTTGCHNDLPEDTKVLIMGIRP